MSRVIPPVRCSGVLSFRLDATFHLPTNLDIDEGMKFNTTISLLIAAEVASRLMDESYAPHPWEERDKVVVLPTC